MRVVCYHMYQVFKPTILNSHSLWLMESQSKSTAKPQSLRPAPVHCDSISKLPVITSRCKSTCDQQNTGDKNPQGSSSDDSHGLADFYLRRLIPCRWEKLDGKLPCHLTKQDRKSPATKIVSHYRAMKTLLSFSLNAFISCPILSLVILA